MTKTEQKIMASNKDLSKQIERLAQIVERMTPPIPAIPAIPSIPSIPAIPQIPPIIPVNSEDHNLLIRLDQKVDSIQTDVTELKKQGSIYVTQPEHSEIVKVCNDHETRIRENEKDITKITTWGPALILLVGIIEFFISNFIK